MNELDAYLSDDQLNIDLKTSNISNKKDSSPDCLRDPELLKRYHDFSRLGKGAQGTIFRAKTKDEADIAIKVFDIQVISSWKEDELFQREIDTLKSLHIKGVPQFIDDFQSGRYRFLVEEYIDAPSLETRINNQTRYQLDDILTILTNILNILIKLESFVPPVIHRDIKPANLLVDDHLNVSLVDFGVVANAKHQTFTMTFAGTAGYVAPEQLYGKATPASDIFSLGATLLHLISGVSPCNMKMKGLKLDTEAYLPPNIPPEFAQLLQQMLDPDPETRIQNAQQCLDCLNAFSRQSGNSENEAPKRDDQDIDEQADQQPDETDTSDLMYDETESEQFREPNAEERQLERKNRQMEACLEQMLKDDGLTREDDFTIEKIDGAFDDLKAFYSRDVQAHNLILMMLGILFFTFLILGAIIFILHVNIGLKFRTFMFIPPISCIITALLTRFLIKTDYGFKKQWDSDTLRKKSKIINRFYQILLLNHYNVPNIPKPSVLGFHNDNQLARYQERLIELQKIITDVRINKPGRLTPLSSSDELKLNNYQNNHDVLYPNILITPEYRFSPSAFFARTLILYIPFMIIVFYAIPEYNIFEILNAVIHGNGTTVSSEYLQSALPFYIFYYLGCLIPVIYMFVSYFTGVFKFHKPRMNDEQNKAAARLFKRKFIYDVLDSIKSKKR